MSRSCALLLALALVLVLFSSSLRANGRFPNAEQLRAVSPGSLAVSGTYGLLVSGNSKDFQFVCESALFGKTLQGSWVDPLLEVLPDSTLLSGSVNGLRVSRDHGCAFESDWTLPYDPAFIPPDPSASGPPGTVADLCPTYDTSHGVLALTTLSASDGSTLEHQLYRTSDGAKSWSKWGAPIPTSLVRVVLTVDVAAADPNRIYVSGSSLGNSVLVASDDAGQSWEAHSVAIDDPGGVAGLYIAAVSRSEPKTLFLRVSRRSEADDGSTTWDDSLLVSDDAGMSSRQVLREPAALLGFALSPDGKTVLAGFGDPVVAPVVVDAAAIGLYAASSDDLKFTQKIPDFSVSCLRWESDALFACAKERDPLGSDPTLTDFHVGKFTGGGVPEQLSDFTSLLKLKDLRGPLPLASGMASSCEAEWKTGDPANPGQASVCSSLGACDGDTVPLSPGAFVCGATEGEAGAGGSETANEGGASGKGSASANGGAGGALSAAGGSNTVSSPARSSTGGACGIGRAGSDYAAWLIACVALAGCLARRSLRDSCLKSRRQSDQ